MDLHMRSPCNHYHQNLAPQPRLPQQSDQLPFHDRDTPMRPATVQQLVAQQAHPCPLLAPEPMRPATGLQVTHPPTAPQIPQHLKQPQLPIAQQPHQQMHQYYANPPHPHQLRYQQQVPYPHPQGVQPYYEQPQLNSSQYHRPYQRNRKNTWRCRYNPMANMMQMGTFFMRAERTLSRMQRLLSRGCSYRGNHWNIQPPPPAGN
ncbi:hypothetical protein PCANC_28232 [Puccinia coronata f. sp. avenae]|uniref:Uncharacterized protein n=1 Tax=Puccinia coronata f. sp. avenae TaxID=200324 RepID=A0A2N5TL43_9BASI|nr:hypothetical protein PCANC_28232 [Puccinia coronata f. sp. avenae]